MGVGEGRGRGKGEGEGDEEEGSQGVNFFCPVYLSIRPSALTIFMKYLRNYI
jgi:hypothetical protein